MMIGSKITHYLIQEKLGQGGMGVVYKAEDLKLKRTVALKFLPPELTRDPEAKERFIQEAQAASALDHPNICTIYEIDEKKPAPADAGDGQMFIAMACYDGETLKQKIASGQSREAGLSVESVIDIAIQIAQGLVKAHEHGIVHRDIKPGNIMITKDGMVKILDFGLAKLAGQVGLTKTGTTVGTIAYMSPEQARGEEVDHRTDIWSFGVVLFEMITGQLPFRGEYEAAIIYEILNEEPKAIQTFRSDVPDHIVSLISQLLQKDPTHRISSTREIIERLQIQQIEKPQEDEKKSIAVLYFENMSSEKENEYFCAGMTEDLIIDLSKIQGLKVIPRSDVLPFRNKEVNIRQLGQTLRVNYILEGSVRKAGGRIRITAQLIDVKGGFQLWAERYDRLIEDIFDIQSEVSQKIVAALKVSLTESEKQSLVKKPTDDLRAYDFYMRGSEFLLQKGRKGNDAAIQMFEHSLSIDPDFSLAYVGLAEAYSNNYLLYDGNRSWLEKMIEMNEKALHIEPDLIEAQFGIGLVYFHQKRFAKAKQAFEKVIKQKNDFYPAHHWLGMISDIQQDYDAAINYYKTNVAIKPYSEEPWMYLQLTFRRKGDLKAAQEAEKKIVELSIRKLEVNPEDVTTLSRMAAVYANMGNTKKALDAAKSVMEIDPNDGRALYNCACVYALLGNKEDALTYLKTALEIGFMNIIEYVKNDPDFESIRGDPKFQEILSKYSV